MFLAGLVVLTGCSLGSSSGKSDPTPAPGRSTGPTATASTTSRAGRCAAVPTSLLAAVQTYVASYGAAVSGKAASSKAAATPGTGGSLQRALVTAQRELQADRCDMTRFRSAFSAGLHNVRAKGPVARAVLLRLTATMTGTAITSPSTVTVRPRQDLEGVLATLATGSTVRLTAGRYHLARSLVLLDGVTLRGAGRDRTSVTSTAGSSGLLVLTDARVELRDLTLRHQGSRPSTLLMGGPSSSVVLTYARVTGARRDKAGNGGNGVMMTAASTSVGRGTTLQVTATQVVRNAAAGVLLTGRHAVSIRRSTFTDNGQCGLCFSGASAGAVLRSTFTGNAAGVAVFDQARPVVADDTFTKGQVAVQVAGHGAPEIRSVRISRVTRAAVIFSDSSTGRIDGAHCRKVPYGIVVSPHALPYVGKNSCPLAKGG